MQVYKNGIADVENDNVQHYFVLLEGLIDSIDRFATMSIDKGPFSYAFRIIPSELRDIDPLITSINSLNNMLGLEVEFSKSIKSGGSIQWKIFIG